MNSLRNSLIFSKMACAAGKVFPDPGSFKCQREPEFLAERLKIWEDLKRRNAPDSEKRDQRVAIDVEFNAGVISGIAFETRPLDLMPELPMEERNRNPIVAARIFPALHSAEQASNVVDADDDDEHSEDDEEHGGSHAHLVQFMEGSNAVSDRFHVLWDLDRPLESSCRLEFVRFEESDGQHVFWHSSAHVLGHAMELEFGGLLTIGPASKNGFYYDVFLGCHKVNEQDCRNLESRIGKIISAGAASKARFERLVVSKEDALRLFAQNPFKLQIIRSRIPDGALTSCYRCGSFIDLCRGPHAPDMSIFACAGSKRHAFSLHSHGAAYWMGNKENDSLQRVYGISFPNLELLRDWQNKQKEIKQRRHQDVGQAQELFFFSEFSPGCAFWLPHGARLYNKLCSWMRSEQKLRGFVEVITPNMFRSEIYKASAHYWTYPERYSLDNEGEEWMLKPMNCPGHCVMFNHRIRSYKELPIRMADFGVLHRKELSGSLSGLSRVRRFQQDDGHIFCRPDQVEEELRAALEFMKYVYGVLGLKYSFVLSTRPKKAIGSRDVWNNAECALAKALNEAGVSWKLNKGDGAFYGPKIDILIEDISGKEIQCATIQLDFQLPLRFNLQYDNRRNAEASNASVSGKAGKADKAVAEDKGTDEERLIQLRRCGLEGALKPGFDRPVMIHRAVFGSLERFSAIITEHFAGRWPFFLNPRQVMVIPVHPEHNDYSDFVALQMQKVGGLYADSNTDRGGSMQKKISRAIEARYSFVAVVGEQDKNNLTVTLRPRDEKEAELLIGDYPQQDSQEENRLVFPLADCVELLKRLNMPSSRPLDRFDLWQNVDPRAAAAKYHH